MNAATATESTALATLPPAARAALALGSTAAELALRELVKASAGIVTVTNKAGREECHTAYMKLKNSRVAVGHTETAATEDAKAFTKAVKTEAARLVAIITTEEDRLQALRDGFDAIEQARKDAELAAEIARVAEITRRIQSIRDLVPKAIGRDSAGIKVLLGDLHTKLGDEKYAEFADLATTAWDATDKALNTALETALQHEVAEAQRLADIAAADKRRAEEAAENARAAAENQRIAAANAAAAKALADQQAALDLAATKQREQAEVNLRADAAARAEADRLVQVERDRVAAAVKAQLDAQQAEIAAARQALADEQAAAEQRKIDAQQAEADRIDREAASERMATLAQVDREEADRMDLQFDIDAAAAAARVVLVVEDAPAPTAITSVPGELADAADELQRQVAWLQLMADDLGYTVYFLVDSLAKIDFAAARAALAVAA